MNGISIWLGDASVVCVYNMRRSDLLDTYGYECMSTRVHITQV